MTGSTSWISRHHVLSGFLAGAVVSLASAMIVLEIYGLFFIPGWLQVVLYPGGLLGSWVYSSMGKSMDAAIIAGYVAVALFYGAIGALIANLIGRRQHGSTPAR
jgi:flagellar biosynthesis protein FliQ